MILRRNIGEKEYGLKFTPREQWEVFKVLWEQAQIWLKQAKECESTLEAAILEYKAFDCQHVRGEIKKSKRKTARLTASECRLILNAARTIYDNENTEVEKILRRQLPEDLLPSPEVIPESKTRLTFDIQLEG